MKKLFLSLFYILLSIVSFALLLPATRMMIDVTKALGPDILTDMNKGYISFIMWLMTSTKSFATTVMSLPAIFWIIILVLYFTQNMKAREWITQTKLWMLLKKWQGALWPLTLPALMVWSVFTTNDFSFSAIFSLIVIGSMCIYASLLSYRATKNGEVFWGNPKQQ